MTLAHKPFRFGILTGGAPTKKEWLDKACQVEDLGYQTLYFGDHLHNDMAPLTAIVAAAGVTSTLRMGSYMFGNDFRHPLMLAKEVATTDQLTGGRFDFGIGSGYLSYDYAQLGLPLDPPGQRIHRLEEAVQVMKRYFEGQPFTYEGKFYHINAQITTPVSVQKPRPPIMMGGGGRRMIELAAREADMVSFNPRTTREGWFDFRSMTTQATAQKAAWFREAAEARSDQIEISALVAKLLVTGQRSEAVEAVERLRGDFGLTDEYLTVDETMESPHVLVGSENAIAEKLHQIRDLYGISHFIFFEPAEAGAKIVRQMTGI